jgi:hypothetical protein
MHINSFTISKGKNTPRFDWMKKRVGFVFPSNSLKIFNEEINKIKDVCIE